MLSGALRTVAFALLVAPNLAVAGATTMVIVRARDAAIDAPERKQPAPD
jgi:hypothetical protein